MTIHEDRTYRITDLERGEGRTVTLLAVPFGETAEPAPGFRERIAPGALDISGPVTLHRGHGEAIGRATKLWEDDRGLHGAFQVSDTAAGNDALTLAADGVLWGASVRMTVDRETVDDEGVRTVEAGRLIHVGLTDQPAYRAAEVAEVREQQEGDPVSDTETKTETEDREAAIGAAVDRALAERDDEHRRQLAALEDRIATIQVRERPQAHYERFGDYARDLLLANTGDREAAERVARDHDLVVQASAAVRDRALADATTGDIAGLLPVQYLRPSLQDNFIRRPTVEALTVRELPPRGMTVEYPDVGNVRATLVGAQATEKTEVTSAVVPVTAKQAAVETLAGAVDISIQALTRSDPSYVEIVASEMTEAYFNLTDTRMIAAINADGNTQSQVLPLGSDAATTHAALVGAARKLYDVLTVPNVLIMSTARWEDLAGLLGTDNRPIYPTLGPMNAPGTINITDPNGGGVLGVRKVVDPLMADADMFLANSSAYELRENPGAPLTLSADRPDVLGRDVAFYGFSAQVPTFPERLVRFPVA